MHYQSTWESLDCRPVAPWWRDAKFGVYLHWTLASVPAWGTHASFYWPNLLKSRQDEADGPRPRRNTLEDEHLGFWSFHQRNYGADFHYPDFAPRFGAELFDPDRWANLFVRSGARYVVLTAKHHDGFCLWPSAEANRSWDRHWNAADIGPHRDLVGDLTAAVRRNGLRMGLYYSFMEWYNPLWLVDRHRFVTEHMLPQIRDLVTRYAPDILWADGEWEAPDTLWRSREFLAWLFNESPATETVVNDRWGEGCRHRHGGYYTTEFTSGMADGRHAWEENRTVTRPRAYDEDGRPLWYEWVHDRQLTLADYYSPRELILTLVDTVSRGGNLLLNVGPTADGRIPVIEEERLEQVGDWLRINGEAIYGTLPWRRSCQWSDGERPEVPYDQEWRVGYDIDSLTRRSGEGQAVVEAFFTSRGDSIYAILPRWPASPLTLKDVAVTPGSALTILGQPGNLKWRAEGPNLVVEMPKLFIEDAPYICVLKVNPG